MRDNESDGAPGWQQPEEYVSPWVPRDGGGSAQAPGFSWVSDGESAEDGGQDTIAFGNQPRDGDPAGYGHPAGDQPGYGSQPGYGNQPGYGSQPGGYGNQPGGYGGQGGYGPRPPRGARRIWVYVAVAALAASIGAGVTIALDSQDSGTSSSAPSSAVPAPHNNSAGSGSSAALNPAEVEKKVDPGLVDITSTLRYRSETAEGTGMIVSSSGLVLTNNHVIDQATSVRATLVSGSGQRYHARILGYDSADDVALLQLEGASGLPAVSFGDSSQVRLGTPVLALGNADGRGGATPARGVINALNRSIQASDQGSDSTENLNHMLQTNARIQQGDSGGALANSAGQVIGMITAANTSGGQSGRPGGTLGFAIPINTALAIAKQINERRSSSTVYIGLPGFLGVEVAQSNSSDPQQQAADEQQSGRGGSFSGGGGGAGLECQAGGQPSSVPDRIAPASTGALIVGILCGTVAQQHKLAPGDVIISVDGHAVTTPSSLTSITAKYHPGEVVSVIWESVGGTRHTTSIRLGIGPAR
jgi:S1-C subfamily serine protease